MVKKLMLKKRSALTWCSEIGAEKFRPALVYGMDKKDLATPRSATGETGRRRIERRAKKLSGYKGTVQVPLTMNVISSLLLGTRTPANSFERCLYNDALVRSRARSAPQPAGKGIILACGACAAKQARDCICSGIAVLHGNVDDQLLSEFVSGIRSPENPVYQPFEPDDQKKLQASLEKGDAVLLSLQTSRNTSVLVRCRHLVRLIYIAAMTGLAVSVEAAAPYLAKNDLRGLRRYFDTAEVVHRGGQCPGTVCRGHIAVQLVDFMRTIGHKMARLLSLCRPSLPTIQRRQVLLSLVHLVFQLASKREYEVDGCGAYKCKRILEITVLAGLSSKLAVPHLLPGDLVSLSGRWPIPHGSRQALRRIMPGMTTKIREQQALKAISLTLGSGGNGKSVPVSTISAMLCFWNEHKNNVLKWVRDWVPNALPKRAAGS